MLLSARLFVMHFFEDRIEFGLLLVGQGGPEFLQVTLAQIHQALPFLAKLAEGFLVAGIAGLLDRSFVVGIIGAPLRRIFLKGGFEALQAGLLLGGQRQAGQ